MTDPAKKPPPDAGGSARERDAANDFTDIDHFGEPLRFDRNGNLLSGKKMPPPGASSPPAA